MGEDNNWTRIIEIVVGAIVVIVTGSGGLFVYLRSRTSDERIKKIETEYQDDIKRSDDMRRKDREEFDKRLNDNAQAMEHANERIALSEQAEERCMKRLKKLMDDLAEQRLLDIERDASIKVLTLEVNRLMVLLALHAKPTVITAGFDGIVLHVSDEVTDMLGYQPEELIGKDVDVIIPPELRDQHHKAMAAASERNYIRGAGVIIEADALHKQGHRVPVTVSLTGKKLGGEFIITASILRRVVRKGVSNV